METLETRPFKEQISQTIRPGIASSLMSTFGGCPWRWDLDLNCLRYARKHNCNLDSETAQNDIWYMSKRKVIVCINGWENQIWRVSKKIRFCNCKVTVTFSLLSSLLFWSILVQISFQGHPGTSLDIIKNKSFHLVPSLMSLETRKRD